MLHLKTLKPLIEAFINEPTVQAYQSIEALINESNDYKNRLKTLHQLQKKRVQSEYNNTDILTHKAKHEAHVNALENDPFLHQYLTLQALVNDDLQWLIRLIETELSAPLKAKK